MYTHSLVCLPVRACGQLQLAILATVLYTANGGWAGQEPGPSTIQGEVRTFLSGGKTIRRESYAPRERGPHPALVVLHAVDGIEGTSAGFYQRLAREYAGRGYVVNLVHYFDGTGSGPNDRARYRNLFVNYFAGNKKSPEEMARMRTLLDAWTLTVRDAVAEVHQQGNVDNSCVGLVGFSLGATLALATASRFELKLGGLVECFGAWPPLPCSHEPGRDGKVSDISHLFINSYGNSHLCQPSKSWQR